jgi:hypothetical protein
VWRAAFGWISYIAFGTDKHAVQREISIPTQRLFWLGGKPQKTLMKTQIYVAIKDSVLVAQRTQFAFLRRITC